MKSLFLVLLLAVSSLAQAEEPTYLESYLYTTSCAIILNSALKQIDKTGIAFDENSPGIPIQDWVDIRLATTAYEDAATKYAATIAELDIKESVAIVYENILTMSYEDRGKAAKNCLKGYMIYREMLDESAI